MSKRPASTATTSPESTAKLFKRKPSSSDSPKIRGDPHLEMKEEITNFVESADGSLSNISSLELTCPRCDEMYDSETRVPIAGLCGHSICQICVNEKKSRKCNTCKMRRSFAKKQENDLVEDQPESEEPRGENCNVMGFACGRCRVKFDTETHIPFMGCCGHSMCSVCVNEKKNQVCPDCNNQQAFAPKKWMKNFLALDLLSKNDDLLTELNARRSNKPILYRDEEKYEGEQIPAILDPKNRMFLAKIVNKLDPVSFLKLASTCKTLYNYCFHTKDIEITHYITRMSVNAKQFKLVETFDPLINRNFFDLEHQPFHYEGYSFGFLGSATSRKKLRNYPFAFNLDYLFIGTDMYSTVALRAFLSEFPVKQISSIDVMHLIDWSELLKFLQDFNVQEVCFSEGCQPPEELYEEVFDYLFHNLISCICYFHVPERFVLSATLPHLQLGRAMSISRNTFIELIKKFADSTDDIDWDFHCEPFALRNVLRLFQVLLFNHEGPLPDERPLIFVKNDNYHEFWLMRKDRKVLYCSKRNFYVCGSGELPRCVSRYRRYA